MLADLKVCMHNMGRWAFDMGNSLKEVESLFQTETVVLFQIDALYIEMSAFFAVL